MICPVALGSRPDQPLTKVEVLRVSPLSGATVALLAVTAVTLASCSPPPKTTVTDGGTGGANISIAPSAADAGGMDALLSAAKKEGALNVIALPPDWANSGEIIPDFEASTASRHLHSRQRVLRASSYLHALP